MAAKIEEIAEKLDSLTLLEEYQLLSDFLLISP